MNDDKIKFCFNFQPVPLPSKSSLGNSVNIELKFIPCLKDKCVAWDEKNKKCKLIKGD